MDPLDVIKRIIESDEASKTKKKPEEVLKAVGVDEVEKASNATSHATPPGGAGKTVTSEAAEKDDKDDDKKDFPFKKKGEKDDDKDEDKKDKKDKDEDDEDDKKKEKKESFDIDTHINALFGTDNLTEDFKSRAKTIFEAAISERTVAIREEITKDNDLILEEAITEIRSTLSEQLDSYLNYVVEQWMETNKVEIDKGIRLEITESFLNGLHKLFKEHNIDVPEGKVDVLGEQSKKIKALEEEVSKEVNAAIALKKEINEFRKRDIVSKLSEGLASTQKDKLAQLTENTIFTTPEEFTKAVTTIKESYFNKATPAAPKKAEVLSENLTHDELTGTEGEQSPEVKPMNESMNLYVKTLDKMAKK